jgi:hypothetical protein
LNSIVRIQWARTCAHQVTPQRAAQFEEPAQGLISRLLCRRGFPHFRLVPIRIRLMIHIGTLQHVSTVCRQTAKPNRQTHLSRHGP